MGKDKEEIINSKDILILILVIVIAYLIANQLGFNQVTRLDRVERFEEFLWVPDRNIE